MKAVKPVLAKKPSIMNNIAIRIGAIALTMTAAIYPQKSQADGFNGQVFLERSEQDQRGFISTQMVMASSIAARVDPSLSECIGRVFFDGTGLSESGFQIITRRIAEFPNYHPSSVLVVVIEKACGAFN